MEIITSVKNDTVRLAKSLAEKKFRGQTGLFLVEGGNIVKDIPQDVNVRFYLATERRADEIPVRVDSSRPQVYYVTDAVMKSLSDTVTPYGLAAVAEIPVREFAHPRGNALLLDGVSDPGNLGTVLRTAAATGFDDVYFLGCADPYSPKTVRASMGGIFRTRLYEVTEEQACELASDDGAVALDMAGKSFTEGGLPPRVTLVAGSEAHGVRPAVLRACASVRSLPMFNGMESLNVAVASAVAMYLSAFIFNN